MSERLRAGEMPPARMPQPSTEVRARVIDWIQAVTMREARKHAGDPGPVLPRRLSNAEYDNTIRDLTGVDIRPAREFPVDPANTEGFDNSGESLTMSPALFAKYVQAAREVSDHLVLNPTISPSRRIRCWRKPTAIATRSGASWRSTPASRPITPATSRRRGGHKHRAALGRRGASLADAAAESKVSARYLATIWTILETPTTPGAPEVGPVATLQAMWRALPAPGGSQPERLHAMALEMRAFVQRIRLHTSMQFAAPRVAGLPPGSQPLLNWKLRQFNLHRREFDPRALRNDTEPEPPVPPAPRYPGCTRRRRPGGRR
jgi:hypothetical protein